MRLAFAAVSLASLGSVLPPTQPGLKIVTRNTFRGSRLETVQYIQTDRKRTEWRSRAISAYGTGSQLHPSAVITRCDTNEEVWLNFDDRTYVVRPLAEYPSRAMLLVMSWTTPRSEPRRDPTLLVETTTVQTGERKPAFGYTARRVVTTRKEIGLDGSAIPPTETEMDGWFIDLDTRASCDVSRPSVRGYLAIASVDSRAVTPPVVAFKDIGEPEKGFPIQLTTTARAPMTVRGGAPVDHQFVSELAVTQLSRESFDPALFEIPAGFRAGEWPWMSWALRWNRTLQIVKGTVLRLFE